MNTPIGLFGLSSPAREVWMRCAIISSAWRWPMTRWFSVSASLSTASISFFTMRPTGMPVQSATTDATACSSTLGRISGRLALQLVQLRLLSFAVRRAPRRAPRP